MSAILATARHTVAKVTSLICCLALACAVFFTIYYAIITRGLLDVAIISFLTSLWIGLLFYFREKIANTLRNVFLATSPISSRKWLVLWILIGLVARIGVSSIWHGQPYSDFQGYIDIGKGLAFEGRYHEGEYLAARPPGLPISLAIVYFVLGDHKWIPLALQCFLFVASMFAVFVFASILYGGLAARLSSVLIAIWPSAILLSWYAAKELEIIPLLTLSLAFYLMGRRRSSLFMTALSGVTGALAALCHGALLLFPSIYVADEILAAENIRAAATRLAVFVALFVVTISPWAMRNYATLGQLIPVSTNAGITLYEGNHEGATGQAMTAFDDKQFGRDEITINRNAWRAATRWIVNHPVGFAQLVGRRITYFLSDDAVGAYWAIARGLNLQGPNYDIVATISNMFWIGVLSLAFVGLSHMWNGFPDCKRGDVTVIMCFLYGISVDAVFEGHSNHHIEYYGMLAVLASLVLNTPRVADVANSKHLSRCPR